VLAYILAAIPLIPSMLSIVELATAMPKAGGTYYFLDRSMGPLVGTVGGLGTWLALMLKTSFALIGMGYYLQIFFPNIPTIPVAVLFALLFGTLNLYGAKKSASLQVWLVLGLLAILSWFIGNGMQHVQPAHFDNFFQKGFDKIISTTGMVYISYVGITKIASVAEEVENPERNLPLGVFLAMSLSVLIYALGTYVMVGVLPMDVLEVSKTPVAAAADVLIGRPGQILVTIAALLAFASVANAGILSASRYPLAMGRDHLLPSFFSRLSKSSTPIVGIIATVVVIVSVLLLFDAARIAKLASAFQLLMFAMVCLAVIVMRESRIESYDPSYRSPFYPWMQIVGIFVPLWLISQMGSLPVLFSGGLLLVSGAWYFYYARNRVVRDGAIFHVFERLGHHRYEPLDAELRAILKERGLRETDPFEEVVAHASFLDGEDSATLDDIIEMAARRLSTEVDETAEQLADGFREGAVTGTTPADHGVALLHVRLPDLEHPQLAMVRSRRGVRVDVPDEVSIQGSPSEPVFAFFFLVSHQAHAGQHLRLLAQIALHVDQDNFMDDWADAAGEQDVKMLMLRDERSLGIHLAKDVPSAKWIGLRLRELNLPDGCLIAVIHRSARTIIPRGDTKLEEDDHVTIIGEPKVILGLRDEYAG